MKQERRRVKQWPKTEKGEGAEKTDRWGQGKDKRSEREVGARGVCVVN